MSASGPSIPDPSKPSPFFKGLRRHPRSETALAAAALLALCSCVRDRDHVLRISVPEQRMALYRKGMEIARFPISTSRFGLGDVPQSNCTPLGAFEVAQKIGDGASLGMKFKDRQPTGEIVPVDAPGRDPIVTRILWLRGLDAENQNAYERMIYIHGTPQESRIGVPSSYGCVRMRSRDVVEVFETVGRGARVFIETSPLPPPAPVFVAAAAPKPAAANLKNAPSACPEPESLRTARAPRP